VVAGRSNAHGAATPYLSPQTVRTDASQVLTQLQVTRVRQAVVQAREAGSGRWPLYRDRPSAATAVGRRGRS
jgi:DNA-binding NarL/FixJ family response regulator